jgi:D-alanyl-D-alanine carboxypeptidase/D-alanyl-D-alanine-endopeptidase (penicillin-binding protein 4)
VDDTRFDDEHWHPDWGDVTARAYHAPVGALMANYGAFLVLVAPGQVGQPARVRLDPPVPYLQLRAGVLTRPGNGPSVRIRRRWEGTHERVDVDGSIPPGQEPEEFWRSVVNPARYTAAVLRMQLAANGIAVEGGTRVAPVPVGAELLLEFEGASLAEICRLFLKHSNNVIAEALLKELGTGPSGGGSDGPGSWTRGIAAEREILAGLGLNLEGLHIVDGSGLSRANRVRARLLVDALRAADRSFSFGPELWTAVPIAATDGTLERRASGAAGLVRAKTGLLSGITGLSGYARDVRGRDMVFSVLVNGYSGSDRAAMDALDGFVADLVR